MQQHRSLLQAGVSSARDNWRDLCMRTANGCCENSVLDVGFVLLMSESSKVNVQCAIAYSARMMEVLHLSKHSKPL